MQENFNREKDIQGRLCAAGLRGKGREKGRPIKSQNIFLQKKYMKFWVWCNKTCNLPRFLMDEKVFDFYVSLCLNNYTFFSGGK
jgi:hypothetical protein